MNYCLAQPVVTCGYQNAEQLCRDPYRTRGQEARVRGAAYVSRNVHGTRIAAGTNHPQVNGRRCAAIRLSTWAHFGPRAASPFSRGAIHFHYALGCSHLSQSAEIISPFVNQMARENFHWRRRLRPAFSAVRPARPALPHSPVRRQTTARL